MNELLFVDWIIQTLIFKTIGRKILVPLILSDVRRYIKHSKVNISDNLAS